MERIKNIYQVTKRLCGMINPQGDSSIDSVRYENLEDTIDVTEKLIGDIFYVSKNKESKEASIKKAGLRADKFITEMRECLNNKQPHYSQNEIQQLQSKVHKITGDGEVMMLFNELLGISAS